MVYLILSAGFENGNISKLENKLKIGYTDNIENRIKAYKTSNPDFILLGTREGDLDLERYLHRKFEKYRYKDNREWFYYNQEIIDNFNMKLEEELLDLELLLDLIKKDIKSNISTIPELSNKYLDDLINELSHTEGLNQSLFDEDFLRNQIVSFWKDGLDVLYKSIDNIKITNVLFGNNLNNSIDEVVVEIESSLPQILGRQRLVENPWKNRAELYYKTKTVTKNSEDFEELIERVKTKKKTTEDLLLSYDLTPVNSKPTLALAYQKLAKSYNYKDDYVAVNTHGGSSLYPVLNDLVMVSEIRAYEIQQHDYKDRFSVVNSIQRENMVVSNERVYEFLDKFHNTYTFFTDKMKLLCEYAFSGEDLNTALMSIPMVYGNYYSILGPEKIKSLSYQKSNLENEYLRLVGNQENKSSLLDLLFDTFKVGSRYTLSVVKDSLKDIYAKSGIDCHPKASDLEKYFELKKVLITNKETGKRDSAYEILKIKE